MDTTIIGLCREIVLLKDEVDFYRLKYEELKEEYEELKIESQKHTESCNDIIADVLTTVVKIESKKE